MLEKLFTFCIIPQQGFSKNVPVFLCVNTCIFSEQKRNPPGENKRSFKKKNKVPAINVVLSIQLTVCQWIVLSFVRFLSYQTYWKYFKRESTQCDYHERFVFWHMEINYDVSIFARKQGSRSI